jgi:hypothetical protein
MGKVSFGETRYFFASGQMIGFTIKECLNKAG